MKKIIRVLKKDFPEVLVNTGSNQDEKVRTVKFPSSSFKGVISRSDDVDYFFIKNLKRRRINAVMNIASRSGDLDLYLLNSRGEVIASSKTERNIERISKILIPGDYYLAIAGYKGALGNYSITVKD